MIEAGLVTFRSVSLNYCKEHFKEFMRGIAAATEKALGTRLQNTEFRLFDGGIAIDLEDLLGYPLIHNLELSESKLRTLSDPKKLNRLVQRIVYGQADALITDTALHLRDAARLNATLFSSSQVSMLSARRMEGFAPNPSDVQVWERTQSVELPWVSELSVEQIVSLREEAGDALPRLRETLGGILRGEESEHSKVIERIQRLREESAEVKADLVALRSKHEAIFRNVAGLLGLGIAVYGFATDFVPAAPALVSLMTLLGLLHGSEHKDFNEAQRLESKPGYVLVKAQELLDHA